MFLYTVSLATLEASSVSIAIVIALAKVKSLSLTLNNAFKTTSAQCFVKRILDRSEIARHHVLSNSSREFLDCFPRLPKHIRPEREALPNNVTGWVELVLHECSDLVNGEFIDIFWRVQLRRKIAERFERYQRLICQKDLCLLVVWY